MTITTLDYCGTGLSFDGSVVHVAGMAADMRPDAVITTAATAANPKTSKTANQLLGSRPRRPEPA